MTYVLQNFLDTKDLPHVHELTVLLLNVPRRNGEVIELEGLVSDLLILKRKDTTYKGMQGGMWDEREDITRTAPLK